MISRHIYVTNSYSDSKKEIGDSKKELLMIKYNILLSKINLVTTYDMVTLIMPLMLYFVIVIIGGIR